MKIAFCISGETDNYNVKLGPESMITYLRQQGHQVNIYGHTWKHCDVPTETDIIKFTELIIEDQEEIINSWVAKDPDRNGWSTNDDNKPHDEFFKEMLKTTHHKIGQHVGGWTNLQQAPAGYDLYVRWRWDLVVSNWWIDKPDMMNELINKQLLFLNTRADRGICMGMVPNNGFIRKGVIALEDTNFYLNSIAHSELCKVNIFHAIEHIWKDVSENPIAYHTLWSLLLLHYSTDYMSTELPNFAHFTREFHVRSNKNRED